MFGARFSLAEVICCRKPCLSFSRLPAPPWRPASSARAATGPDVTDFKLANGLEVVVVPDHRAPVVTHMIWYKVGAADETPGKSGLAHFLEHLMFKGTEKNPGAAFSQDVAAIGGQENAFTASDYTGFYQRVPREHLKEMMAFEADRMTGLVLTDDVVRPELKVVLEEQNMRVANNPGARLSEQMDAALYLNHPYGRPVIGWRHEIEKLNRDDALAFYRRFYTPNNAIVVVAGDVTPDEVKADAEETYGKVADRAPTPIRGSGRWSRCRRRRAPSRWPIRASSSRASAAIIWRPRKRPPSPARARRSTFSPTCSAAARIAGCTGRWSSTRASRSMPAPTIPVRRSITANSVSTARRSPASTLHDVEAGIDAVLNDVIDHGITADELDRAKTRLIADAVYAQDNQATLARWYGAALATGQTVDMVRTWPDRIRAVTADAVQQAARNWLDRRRSVTGYLVQSLQPEESHS